MAEYLAIPALSQSILQTMLDECPRAAWFDSWLNPKRVIEVSGNAQDVGSVAHSVLLEGHANHVVVIDPKDHPGKTKPYNIPKGFTNDSIKAARDAVIADGKVPLLPEDRDKVAAMVAEALQFIDSLKDSEPAIWRAFQPQCGQSEVTFMWDEDGIPCRIRTDRIATDYRVIADYKTSGMTVEPNRFGRTQVVNNGFYIGAAFYRRGIKALTGKLPVYVWLAQEQEAPYLCSLVGCDPQMLAVGGEKIAYALGQWRKCAQANCWPGYPSRVCYPELPQWVGAQWENRQINEGIDYVSQA